MHVVAIIYTVLEWKYMHVFENHHRKRNWITIVNHDDDTLSEKKKR